MVNRCSQRWMPGQCWEKNGLVCFSALNEFIGMQSFWAFFPTPKADYINFVTGILKKGTKEPVFWWMLLREKTCESVGLEFSVQEWKMTWRWFWLQIPNCCAKFPPEGAFSGSWFEWRSERTSLDGQTGSRQNKNWFGWWISPALTLLSQKVALW